MSNEKQKNVKEIPYIYKGYKEVPRYADNPMLKAKAWELANRELGYEQIAIIDGKEFLFVINDHIWRNGEKLYTGKVATVYEKEDEKPEVNTDDNAAKMAAWFAVGVQVGLNMQKDKL